MTSCVPRLGSSGILNLFRRTFLLLDRSFLCEVRWKERVTHSEERI